jgi:hypothetical protein
MKTTVHGPVGGLVGFDEVAFAEDAIALLQAHPQLQQQGRGYAALHDAADGKALQDAPQIDGIEDVAAREVARANWVSKGEILTYWIPNRQRQPVRRPEMALLTALDPKSQDRGPDGKPKIPP